MGFEVEDLGKVANGLALLVPGLLILYVRTQFLSGRAPSHTEALLSYVVVTVIYYAVVLPFFALIVHKDAGSLVIWLGWVSLIIIVPMVIGLLLGLGHQKKWYATACEWLGWEVVHSMPTAWDWKFAQRTEHWLIITLKDGTLFHGFYGRKSFASSDNDRDIYIEQIFSLGRGGRWIPMPNGLWVQTSEVSTIEFLDIDRTEEEND
ncbi:DUF6338 family protein [Mesorhizobium sp. 113-3-3]|uniref:DUF6338 family protein n=1 Tax=Mesorhizobium sp. 113-3-3 TaxID=2744516 RepID=UPI001928A0C8|nr:DUF6338 family protein [Mesorhizobium sp. 113-3-3]BCG80103.1 hypothetical protein MesoLj113b_36450 [Mesorhizobium sp. 113-3-3]